MKRHSNRDKNNHSLQKWKHRNTDRNNNILFTCNTVDLSVHACISADMLTYTYACTQTHMNTMYRKFDHILEKNTNTCLCICMYKHPLMHAQIHTNVHVHMHTYIHTHAHIHTCTHSMHQRDLWKWQAGNDKKGEQKHRKTYVDSSWKTNEWRYIPAKGHIFH